MKEETFKNLFTRVIVPYFEFTIDKLGLVGKTQIELLKAKSDHDPENPEHNPQHQRCVVKLDVYAVHRSKVFRAWF